MGHMVTTSLTQNQVLPLSQMAETLQGSEIIKLAGEINDKIKQGKKIFNFTIGDFDPQIFPIPIELENEIILAYKNGETNYPPANGIQLLRENIAAFITKYQGLNYSPNDFLIAGGARPLIFAAYLTILDKGEKVIFPVPSWNNNHYTHLSNAQQIIVEARPDNNFMPTAKDIKKHLKSANLLALCSPLNPTGTTFTKEGLLEICEMVLEENLSRPPGKKPLYLLYDQIYWALTYGKTIHYNPVSLVPEIKPYTIFIDGLSKAFAATGVRVGWAFGPSDIIEKMKSILGHVGAWAPKAEQVATANYLSNQQQAYEFIEKLKSALSKRLYAFYEGFTKLKEEGFPVDVIEPQAALYLTLKIDLIGLTKPDGELIENTEEATQYILNSANVAIVPFYAFGASKESTWYRLSVGTCKVEDIDIVINSIRKSLKQLSK
jgi:aspartate aminotransferase